MNKKSSYHNHAQILFFLFTVVNTIICQIHGFKLNYKWDASINAQTGVANSLEQSFTTSSNIYKQNNNKNNNNFPSSSISSNEISKLFSNYPSFLCQKGVTFCLLQARKQNEKNKDNNYYTNIITKMEKGAIDLLLPIVNIPLLTFGQPKTTSFTRKGGNVFRGVDNSDSDGCVYHQNDVEVITEIPILGGLLACLCTSYHNQNGFTNTNKWKNQYSDIGRLQFKYIYSSMMKISRDGAENTNLNDHDTINKCTGVMETRIINYRSSIAGCALPMKNYRKMIYLSFQSRLHAYVMKRFHYHCQKSIMAA